MAGNSTHVYFPIFVLYYQTSKVIHWGSVKVLCYSFVDMQLSIISTDKAENSEEIYVVFFKKVSTYDEQSQVIIFDFKLRSTVIKKKFRYYQLFQSLRYNGASI